MAPQESERKDEVCVAVSDEGPGERAGDRGDNYDIVDDGEPCLEAPPVGHTRDSPPYKRRRPLSSHLGQDESDDDDDDDDTECGECDGDGSCIETILTNLTAMKGTADHTVRTQTVNVQGLGLIEKTTLIGARPVFDHTPKDLFSLLNRNMGSLSIQWMCQEAPLTLLHASVIHKRTEVLGVLADCGFLSKLWDCPVRDETSEYCGRTALEIAELHKNERMVSALSLQKTVEASLGWLHRSARDANLIAMRALIEKHPSLISVPSASPPTASSPPPGVQCHTGTEPIFWAVTSGSTEAVQYLISRGADVRSTSNEGETLLTHAAALGHTNIVKLLVEQYSADVNEPGFAQKTALQRAIQNRDVALVKLLVQLGADVPDTLLNDVAATGHMGVFATLREHFSNIDVQDDVGRFPLYYAIQKDKLRLAEELIKEGAKLHLKDRQQRNILHLAVSKTNMETFEFVLRHLSQKTKNKKKTMLRRLMDERDLYVGSEQCFLVRGRDQGAPAYHYVNVQRFYLSVFRQMTQAGGAVDVANYGTVQRSGWGTSPSSDVVASMERRYDISKLTDTDAPDLTPLNLAILKENYEMALTLIKHGADVNLPDSSGMTPLHMACMRGSLDVVKSLESKGACADARDSKDRRPLEAAEKNGHSSIVNFLEGNSTLNNDELAMFRKSLEKYLERLAVPQLEVVRAEGKNVHERLVEDLRKLTGEVEKMCYVLGKGPVGPESNYAMSQMNTSQSQCASQH